MKYIINLNDRVYEVEVEKGEAEIVDEYDFVPSDKSSNSNNTTAKVSNSCVPNDSAIKAPIPGNILSIKVKEGQQVKRGEVLLLIEAMKMENEICAPNDGTVKKIFVTAGQTVATGDNLLEI